LVDLERKNGLREEVIAVAVDECVYLNCPIYREDSSTSKMSNCREAKEWSKWAQFCTDTTSPI